MGTGVIGGSSPLKAGWLGQQLLTLPSGLVLVPGSGILGRTDAVNSRLLLDAQRSEVPETMSLFVPGLVASKTLGVWGNHYQSKLALLLALEANFLTAPTSGDVNNFYRVVATDSLANTVVLPISTTGVSHYVLDRGFDVKIAQLNTPNTGIMNGGFIGFGYQFTPTQNLVLTGVQQYLSVSGVGGGGSSRATRMTATIWDANRTTIIAQGTATTVADFNLHLLTFAFPLAVTLTSGTAYVLTFDGFSDWPAQPSDPSGTDLQILAPNTSGALSGQPIAINNTYLVDPITAAWPHSIFSANAGGFTWPQFGSAAFVSAGWQFAVNSGSTPVATFALLGSPSGATPMTGDVTFTISSVGVAPVTPGSDVNVRAVLAAA